MWCLRGNPVYVTIEGPIKLKPVSEKSLFSQTAQKQHILQAPAYALYDVVGEGQYM